MPGIIQAPLACPRRRQHSGSPPLVGGVGGGGDHEHPPLSPRIKGGGPLVGAKKSRRRFSSLDHPICCDQIAELDAHKSYAFPLSDRVVNANPYEMD